MPRKINRRERDVKSLFTLCFNSIVKNIGFYGNDQGLQYLTPGIKEHILRSLNHSFWRISNFKNIFTSLLHSNLEIIDLTKAHLDDDLLRTLQICKRLQKIYLIQNGTYKISKKELENFIQNQTELHTLVLNNCHIVDNTTLKNLSTYCQKIKVLDIKGCKRITDRGLRLLRSLKYLNSINLSNTMISNDGLIGFIKEPTGHLLTELMLSDCVNLSDKILPHVPNYCPNLKIFVCCQSNAYMDMSEFFEGLSNLKNLKQLSWRVSW